MRAEKVALGEGMLDLPTFQENEDLSVRNWVEVPLLPSTQRYFKIEIGEVISE